MLWHRQASFKSKGDKLSSNSKLGSLRYQIAGRLNAHSRTDWALEDEAKLELNSLSLWWVSIQPNWLHCRLASAPGPSGYTCCLLLISMFWHRQAIFESKADKLSSSAEWMQDRKLGSRRHQIANRENVHSQTDRVIEDQATLELDTCIHTYVRRYVRAYIHIYINFLEYSKVYSIFVWVYDTEKFKSLYHLEHHGMALFFNTSLLWGECHETHLLISQLWFG